MMAAPIVDRISRLPDSLLLHILSHLNITEAARSSAVSRRWRPLWLLLPSLHFPGGYPSLSEEEAIKKVINVISQVMIRNRAPSLTSVSFYLPFYRPHHADFLRWCIAIALGRCVGRLSILLNNCSDPHVIPSYLFGQFNSLNKLHLSCCSLSLPESHNCRFSCLTSLHISDVDLAELQLQRLTSRTCCPVLQILNLTNCNERGPLAISLNNSSIRLLSIVGSSLERAQLQIQAPHVTHLKLAGAWRRYEVVFVPAIVEATLDFDIVPFPWSNDEGLISLSVVNTLLTSLPFGARLHLSPWFLQVFRFTKFESRIKPLVIAKNVVINTGLDFYDIPDLVFLFNSSEIEHLTINISNKGHINENLCSYGCHCNKIGLYTKGADDAGKKYCMLFDQSLLVNHTMKTVVLNGFYKERGNVESRNFCSFVRRTWQFELVRIILLKLKNLDKMVLIGSSVQLRTSSLIAEMCSTLPKAVSTTLIECYNVKGGKTEKMGVIPSSKFMALRVYDRLSEFPDDLLVHILSFLGLRDAVSTSILSKRWKHLWTLLPSLDFNSCMFSSSLWKRTKTINHVLAQLKASKLSSFSLRFCDRADAQHDSWIAFAVSRHVRRLVLHLHYYELPPYLFYYSHSLTYLELKLCIITLPQLSFSFSSLKTLCIVDTKFEDPSVLERLTSSIYCPVLEKLQLTSCNLFNPLRVCFNNPTLIHLCLRDVRNRSLDICLPHVSHLELLGKWGLVKSVTVKHLSSLTKAIIDVDDSIELCTMRTICRIYNSFPEQIHLTLCQCVHQILNKYQIPPLSMAFTKRVVKFIG